jgi:hypothetical protein
VDEKIRQLKSGINLSMRVVNKQIEDFSIFYMVENKAEISNATVILNNSHETGSARLEVLVGVNDSDRIVYEGAAFTNIVELRPGDVCGQCYRLHNHVTAALKDGDTVHVLLNIIVENQTICNSSCQFVFEHQTQTGTLKDHLVSEVSKYETGVPAFSRAIRGFGRSAEKKMIQAYLEEQLVVIYGPSRVGKSSLMNYIANDYINEYAERENQSILCIGIADDRHGNDYEEDMLNGQEKVSFDPSFDVLRYLFISPLKLAFLPAYSLKSRMRCQYAGSKMPDAVKNEIQEVLASEGSVREIVSVVAQILEANNCQIWLLFDEFQQIVEKWQGPASELVDLCNDIMYHQSSIKIVFCGSDDLVRLYRCENDANWRDFVRRTADHGVFVGQLGQEDFYAMMKDNGIWQDVTHDRPWSEESLTLLYQYTGGNAICGKLFGNELIHKLKKGEFNHRERFYPSDMTQVACELLNSEVGLVRNLLVIHNTKNLEAEIPYLLFIAGELIQDRNKADISITRIREFFADQSSVEIENAMKILVARGILKTNEEKQRYGFSNMFYFDFFRSQATEGRLEALMAKMKSGVSETGFQPDALTLIDQFGDLSDKDKMTVLSSVYHQQLNPDARESFRKSIGDQHYGDVVEGTKIGTQTNIQVNIQNMTNALTSIMSGENVLEAYQKLPTLSAYMQTRLTSQEQKLLQNKYEALEADDLSDDQRQTIQEEIDAISSPAIDAIASDYMAAQMQAVINGSDVFNEDDENAEDEYAVIGISRETVDEIRQSLPSGIQIQFDFAIMLHKIFYQLKDEQNIDYCPVAILYCKLIEGLLKEKHFEIYIRKLSRGDYPKVRINGRDFDWRYFLDQNGQIDKKKVQKTRKKLTIGSFSFPLGRISNVRDSESKVILDENVIEALATPIDGDMPKTKDLQLWKKHAAMLPWIREYRNMSAHELIPVTREDMDHISDLLFNKKEMEIILRLR